MTHQRIGPVERADAVEITTARVGRAAIIVVVVVSSV